MISTAYRIFLKLNRIFLPIILRIIKKFNWNVVTCNLLVWIIRINSKLWKKSNGLEKTKKNNYKTILCFNRAIFDKDLIEIEKRTNLNILVFDNEHYTIFADTYLSNDLRDQMTYFHVADPSKEKFYNLIDEMILRFQTKLDFDALLNSNIIYYQDHEWSKVCRKRNIPFLTLCKEVPATNKNEKIWIRDWSGFPYFGDKIAVYSQWTKNILLNKCNIGSDKIYTVTGCPRTDPIYDIYSNRNDNCDNSYIVLFDFLEYEKPILWENTIDSFIKSANYSLNNKYDYQFIIKTKYHAFNPIVEKYLDKLDVPLDNIQITHDLNIKEIARYSKLICGFRTTAIIKLMISDIDIVIVDWAEALEEPEDRLITDKYSESCFVANSKGIFYEILQDRLFNKNVEKLKRSILRDKIIEKNLYKIDGKRSIAFEKFVYSSI